MILYADVLFGVNLSMDLLSLGLTASLTRRKIGKFRLFAAASLGALGATVFTAVPGIGRGASALCGVLLSAGMAAAAFGWKDPRRLLADSAILWGAGCALGGLLTLFSEIGTPVYAGGDGFPILYLGAAPPDFATFEPPQALPTVIISTQHHPYCATISNDQMGCSVSIVDHFIQKGHREIRFVGGRRESNANISRQKGWEQALRMRGLRVVEPLYGDWTADSGYEIGLRLAQDKSCTAVYASNDAIAVGIIYALRDAGLRVPQDVSVIGVDDSLIGVIPHLELSSYRFNDAQVGALAFDLATNPPEGKEPPHILVPGTLVERSTVAPANR